MCVTARAVPYVPLKALVCVRPDHTRRSEVAGKTLPYYVALGQGNLD
jgi:hypothetical protein